MLNAFPLIIDFLTLGLDPKTLKDARTKLHANQMQKSIFCHFRLFSFLFFFFGCCCCAMSIWFFRMFYYVRASLLLIQTLHFFAFLQLGSFHSRAIIFIRTLCFFLGAFFPLFLLFVDDFVVWYFFFVLSATFRLNSSLDISLLFFFSTLDVCTLLFPSLFRIFVKPCSTRS